jgi:hypothetical protein
MFINPKSSVILGVSICVKRSYPEGEAWCEAAKRDVVQPCRLRQIAKILTIQIATGHYLIAIELY